MQRNSEPFALADEAASVLARQTGVKTHDTVVVLGSGWGETAHEMGEIRAELPLDQLPGFPKPSVHGHRNSALSIEVGEVKVLVLGGRVHLYEGYPASTVVHAVRTGIAAGCNEVILTNAAGGLRPEWQVGQPVRLPGIHGGRRGIHIRHVSCSIWRRYTP